MMRSYPFPLCVLALTLSLSFSTAQAQEQAVPDVVDPFVVMGLDKPSGKGVAATGVNLPKRVPMEVADTKKTEKKTEIKSEKKADKKAPQEEASLTQDKTSPAEPVVENIPSTQVEGKEDALPVADASLQEAKPQGDFKAKESEPASETGDAKWEVAQPAYVSREDAQRALATYTNQRVRGMGSSAPAVLPQETSVNPNDKPEFIKRAEEEARRAEAEAKAAQARAEKAKKEGKVNADEAAALIVPDSLIVAPPVDEHRGEMGEFLPYLEGQAAHGPLLADLIKDQEAKAQKRQEQALPVATAIPLTKEKSSEATSPMSPEFATPEDSLPAEKDDSLSADAPLSQSSALEADTQDATPSHVQGEPLKEEVRTIPEAWLTPTYENVEIALTPLYGVTPFMSTQAELKSTFPNAHLVESDTLGPRLVIPGADMGGDALEAVVSFNEKGLASSLFIKYRAADYDEVLAALKDETKVMAPEGIWLDEGSEKLWITRHAQLRVYPIQNDTFSIEYGPNAPMQRASLAYLMRDTENRLPRLSGLMLGVDGIQSSLEKLSSRAHCQVDDPLMLGTDEVVIAAHGACLGLPGERESQLTFSPETHALTQLQVHFEPTPEGNKLIEQAIEKRYEKSETPGLYQYGQAHYRHVLVPTLRLDFKEGFLTMMLYTDGIQKAQKRFETEKTRQQDRREAQKQVDALFE